MNTDSLIADKIEYWEKDKENYSSVNCKALISEFIDHLEQLREQKPDARISSEDEETTQSALEDCLQTILNSSYNGCIPEKDVRMAFDEYFRIKPDEKREQKPDEETDAQIFLLDNKCGDLILNDRAWLKPEDRIYASEIMEKFAKLKREEQPEAFITVDYPDHTFVVLTNQNGDTYTSKSSELKDFLHGNKKYELREQKPDDKGGNDSLYPCWVKASEPPTPFFSVLVCFEKESKGMNPIIRTGSWVGDSFSIDGNYPILTKTITHWMPLPTPPKTEQSLP